MSARKRSSSGRAAKATRLPAGGYALRGRVVPFSRLPKSEQHRFRSLWAAKAVKTRARERAISERDPAAAVSGKERKAAREWIKRRSEKVGKAGAPAKEVLSKLGPKAILAARELQRAAHKAYKGAKSREGGRAREIAEQIREALGKELASAMPQLWWYH